MKNSYTVGIIGAGRIGSSFDSPNSERVLSHAHAVFNNPRLKLVGLADTDGARGKSEAAKWKTDFYPDREEMLAQVKPDIVVIATPDETHTDILLNALRARPRLVICEKPVASTAKDASKIEKAAGESGVPVIVNFRRRFDPTVRDVQKDILRGRWGAVISASAHYAKGLFHSGSHALDLARFFFGEMTSAHAHFRVDDFPEGMPTVGGVATFERCPQFHLIAGDERSFSFFEFEIVLEKKRLRFVDEGFFLVSQDIVPDPVFKGYHVLGKEAMRKTGLIRSMSLLMENAVGVLDGAEIPLSTLPDALKTEEACQLMAEGL